MSRNIFKSICIAIGLVLSSFAFASGGTSYGEIVETYVNAEWTMVQVAGVTENPDSCTTPSSPNNWYALDPADTGYASLHSTLLAAHMAGKSVRFWVSGCTGQNNNYPHIVSVFVK